MMFWFQKPAVFGEDLYYLPERDAPLKGKAYIMHGSGLNFEIIVKRALKEPNGMKIRINEFEDYIKIIMNEDYNK